MRSRAPFSAQLRVFHQNISCSMHTFPLELSPSGCIFSFFLSFFLSPLLQFLESHCFVRSWVSLCSILSLIASVALLMLSVSSLYRSLIFSLLLMCLYSSHVRCLMSSRILALRAAHVSPVVFIVIGKIIHFKPIFNG